MTDIYSLVCLLKSSSNDSVNSLMSQNLQWFKFELVHCAVDVDINSIMILIMW